jgi:uncharacterized membrane protein
MEAQTKTSLVIAVLKRLTHARKAGVVLAAALIGSAALSSSTIAAGRAHYVKCNTNALKATAPALESFLAQLLHYGTWIACGAIAVGLIETFAIRDTRAMSFFELGIGLFIALPIIRVMALLVHFVKTGDRHFGAIAGLLIIMSGGLFLGLRG